MSKVGPGLFFVWRLTLKKENPMPEDETCGVEETQQCGDRDERVRLAAYYRWKEYGERDGCDLEDWCEAEKSIG